MPFLLIPFYCTSDASDELEFARIAFPVDEELAAALLEDVEEVFAFELDAVLPLCDDTLSLDSALRTSPDTSFVLLALVLLSVPFDTSFETILPATLFPVAVSFAVLFVLFVSASSFAGVIS